MIPVVVAKKNFGATQLVDQNAKIADITPAHILLNIQFSKHTVGCSSRLYCAIVICVGTSQVLVIGKRSKFDYTC